MSPPRSVQELVDLLQEIEGRGYKAYKRLQGPWSFDGFLLEFDHVQGDPFADPSRVRVIVEADVAGFDPRAYANEERALGVAALLVRTFRHRAREAATDRGSGKSGTIRMEDPGQVVLPQTAVRVDAEGGVEARFAVGLPARGRRISGHQAVRLLTDDVPGVVRDALMASAHPPEEVERCAAANEDATLLREALEDRGLVAFIADGSHLPRRSGVDDRPMDPEEVVPFQSPPSLQVTIPLPNAGDVTGMGIPEGVTLIVGGGFHGKSTVLRALQDGVYNHRPDDGRELAVADAATVKVRSEDGRAVTGVDISGFIDGLPLGRPTRAFTSENASGSTSQAAAIVESLEAGARVLLVDEDTSATNFMIRDRRMQELVPSDGEPITPFIDRVQDLHTHLGVSTVLVIGGSGDYLDVADQVIRMRDYVPEDVTGQAMEVAEALPTGRVKESDAPLPSPEVRRLRRDSLDPSRRRRSTYVKVPDDRTLLFGSDTIDLAAVEQLALRSQTRAVGLALASVARDFPDVGATVSRILDWVEERMEEDGLDALSHRRLGTLTAFRRFELAAALNRLRTLQVE
ncbi:MAG: ABC-ATPase domain-containing protein [Longimicrobiales bacterium]|nr:ABC-ATPase domain-containing protein [Longimicrobiales bacterium]